MQMCEKEVCTNILLSIIIPVYNVQDYIADCLDSIIEQEFPSMEIICVDDCSTDKSLDILKKYASKDWRIKVVKLNQNGGQANARNVGVEKACGTYICYLDSDDMLADGALNQLLPYMNEDLDMLTYEISAVQFDIRPKNVDDDVYRLKYDYSILGITSGKVFFAEMVEHGEFFYNVVFSLYRRSWLLSSGIRFKEGMIYEDGPYILACYLQCKKMQHVCIGVYVRRYRADSTMTTVNKANFLHMSGLLWGYEEALRLYYQTDNLNQRERRCLFQLIVKNRETARRHAFLLPPAEAMHFHELKGIPYLLSLGIYSSISNSQLYLDGLRWRIMKSEQIYLYGAGQIGLLTISYLRSVGLEGKVIGFVESQTVTANMKYGIPLFCMRDIIPREGTLLILSAASKYQEDMLVTAEQQGFADILIIDLLLRQLMQQIVDQKLNFNG